MTWLVWRRYRLTMGVTLAVLVALASLDGVAGAQLRRGTAEHRLLVRGRRLSARLQPVLLPQRRGVAGEPRPPGPALRTWRRLRGAAGGVRARAPHQPPGVDPGRVANPLAVDQMGDCSCWLWVPSMAVLTVVAQWWSGHVTESNLLLHIFPAGRFGTRLLPGDRRRRYGLRGLRLQPGYSVGALVRRTGWAVFVTVVLYGAIAVFMALVVRPEPRAPTVRALQPLSRPIGYRRRDEPVPGRPPRPTRGTLGPVTAIAPGWQKNEARLRRSGGADVLQSLFRLRFSLAPAWRQRNADDFAGCLTQHHVQEGELYQTADHYWTLQWRESAILIGASASASGAR